MRKNRGILTALVLVGLCAVAAGAGWFVASLGLLDPAHASRDDLFRWLVLRDLDQEPPQTQLALVERLQQELRAGIEIDGAARALDDSQRVRLRNNVQLLKHVWFVARVDDYERCEPSRRMAYLEEQLATVMSWTAIDLRSAAAASDTVAADARATEFFDEIEHWIEQATGPRRERMIVAVQDGVVCWLATKDLDAEPMDTRRDLALRIARELNAGMRLDTITLELSATQREQLIANGQLLLEAWLHEQAGLYAQMPAADREAYVGRQIDNVMAWGLLEALAPPNEAADATTNLQTAQRAGLMKLMTLTDTWIAHAEPSQRPALEQFVADVKLQLLRRQLQQMLTPKK
jgi:hypothetical protein